jgi:hypothetical protein
MCTVCNFLPSCTYSLYYTCLPYIYPMYTLLLLRYSMFYSTQVVLHTIFYLLYTGLFEMTVGILTTCHTQHTSDSSMQFHRWIKKFSQFSFMMRGVQYLCIVNYAYSMLTATDSLKRTRLSCCCLKNHKRCTYRAPVMCVTETGVLFC